MVPSSGVSWCGMCDEQLQCPAAWRVMIEGAGWRNLGTIDFIFRCGNVSMSSVLMTLRDHEWCLASDRRAREGSSIINNNDARSTRITDGGWSQMFIRENLCSAVAVKWKWWDKNWCQCHFPSQWILYFSDRVDISVRFILLAVRVFIQLRLLCVCSSMQYEWIWMWMNELWNYEWVLQCSVLSAVCRTFVCSSDLIMVYRNV